MSLNKDARCRLCLQRSSSYVEATDRKQQTLTQKILEIFSLQITSGGVFPTRVCLECVKQIEQYYSFFVQVISSQNILHNEYIKLQAVDDVSNDNSDNTTNIVKIEPELELSYFVKIENEPVKNKELIFSDSERNVEKESNASHQPKISSTDHELAADHDYESALDAVSSDKDNIPPTIVDNTSLNYNIEFYKNTPIELYKNGKLMIKGKRLSEIMKKFFDLRCGTCDPRPQFDSIEAYFNHCRNEHGARGFVTCCGRNISDKENIIYHVTKHVQPLAFQCPSCKKSYTRPHALKCHLKTHLPEYKKGDKRFICDYCKKKYTAKEHLKLHIRNMHIPTTECSCPHCNKKFTSKNALTYHIKINHKETKQLCPICGKKVTMLNIHLISHDDNAKICCKECGFVAKNKLSHRNHMKSQHSVNLETLKCDKCEYCSKNKHNLLRHMKYKHPDQKSCYKHQCSFCGRKFNLKKTLEDHLNQHTGEKKYMCKYCPRTFASGGNKYSHMKRMHKDQKLQETLEKQHMYNNALEKQLLEENERIKNEELLKLQVKEYLNEMERKRLSTKTSKNNVLN